MKKLLVANFRQENHRYSLDSLFTLVKAQIENNLELGWKPEDILLISNKEFEYMGIKTQIVHLNDFCFTGSKVFAVKWCFENGINDVIWASDLDCWQDYFFSCPDFNDVGVTEYSRPKINGGSIFWKPQALDLITDVTNILTKDKLQREEPTLNKVLRKHPDRITVLNNTYNVGCSGYMPRCDRSIKPIRVFHFHPTNSIAWETQVLDRTGIGMRISNRLEKLIRKYYSQLATSLSEKGRLRREQKLAELKNGKKYNPSNS